jgi:enoyl-CoA hydratase/carnithine racemase
VSDYITTERRDEIAIVRFNRPDQGNAVFPAVMEMLCGQLDEAIADPEVEAIVLSHVGRHFVAGADFEWLETLTGATMPQIRDDIYQWFQGAAKRIHLCPKPVVAAIRGAAITVGFQAGPDRPARLAQAASSDGRLADGQGHHAADARGQG